MIVDGTSANAAGSASTVAETHNLEVPVRAKLSSLIGTVRALLFAVLLTNSRTRRPSGDAGMSTAEYAVGTVAAVAFAVVLYKVVTSSAVMTALSKVIKSALSVHIG